MLTYLIPTKCKEAFRVGVGREAEVFEKALGEGAWKFEVIWIDREMGDGGSLPRRGNGEEAQKPEN